MSSQAHGKVPHRAISRTTCYVRNPTQSQCIVSYTARHALHGGGHVGWGMQLQRSNAKGAHPCEELRENDGRALLPHHSLARGLACMHRFSLAHRPHIHVRHACPYFNPIPTLTVPMRSPAHTHTHSPHPVFMDSKLKPWYPAISPLGFCVWIKQMQI